MKTHIQLALLLSLFIATSAQAERRALLMGNKDYQISPLNNPINDVIALKPKLIKLGFKVTLKKNLNRKEMRKAIRNFKNSLSRGDLAIVYYSGHGAQVNGDNYLIPVNNDIRDEFEISDGGVSLNFLMKSLVTAGSTNIIILDACRDNPFKRRFKSNTRGLARIKQKVGGTLVAFAASAGGVSQDGRQKNGTYTKYLLKHIATSGISLNEMFTRVRKDVVTATSNDQFPIEENGLLDTIYLAGNQSAQNYSNKQQNSPNQPQPAIINTVIQKPRMKYEPEMVPIRGGTFTMGSPANEKDRDRDEKPYRVTVKDFWIGKTEVTFAQWDACVAGGGCQSNKQPDDEGWGRGNRPVINVSWHDANEYTRWLSQKTGKAYRLPTEAEWEYAARGGTKTAFSFGNRISTNQANYDGNYTYNGSRKGTYLHRTAKASSYPANRYGLYDMHGNVLEWVCSAYDTNYGGSEQQCANRNDNRSRVLRGGSWLHIPRDLRSANRSSLGASDRNDFVGFRISRTF